MLASALPLRRRANGIGRVWIISFVILRNYVVDIERIHSFACKPPTIRFNMNSPTLNLPLAEAENDKRGKCGTRKTTGWDIEKRRICVCIWNNNTMGPSFVRPKMYLTLWPSQQKWGILGWLTVLVSCLACMREWCGSTILLVFLFIYMYRITAARICECVCVR